MKVSDAKLLLLEALASPHGLLLQCSDPERVRERIYSAKRLMGVTSVSVRRWPGDEANLAIVRTDVAAPAQRSEGEKQ